MPMMESQRMALMAMADHLEHEVRDAQFEMGAWWKTCGTIGCAVGHCIGLLPGLELKASYTDGQLRPRSLKTGRWNYQALSDELGMTEREAEWLFAPEWEHRGLEVCPTYRNRSEVYTRIRAFAKGEVAP